MSPVGDLVQCRQDIFYFRDMKSSARVVRPRIKWIRTRLILWSHERLRIRTSVGNDSNWSVLVSLGDCR